MTQKMIQPNPDEPCQWCGVTEHKQPIRCKDGGECPHCGGIHYASYYCPYSKTQTPEVVTAAKDMSALALESGAISELIAAVKPPEPIIGEGVRIDQTPIVSAQLVAPLDTNIETSGAVYEAAVIENGYQKEIALKNGIFVVVLKAGERRVLKPPLLAKKYNEVWLVHEMVEWDPLAVLKDLIAEYERSQDALFRYNWSVESLLEASQLRAFREAK